MGNVVLANFGENTYLDLRVDYNSIPELESEYLIWLTTLRALHPLTKKRIKRMCFHRWLKIKQGDLEVRKWVQLGSPMVHKYKNYSKFHHIWDKLVLEENKNG
ncbi:hypothetical protein UFOVP67_40 [uncultured Caudovirales phage]|uniref:Uncharacterized protein n=1 Tax=uncultured Caudovirales phage TaxID=2100421 RepID=A0A6J5TAS2_9CAUD|nr:hypothetical protein UFOVP67_40 [uncultured Caudovirales phage]